MSVVNTCPYCGTALASELIGGHICTHEILVRDLTAQLKAERQEKEAITKELEEAKIIIKEMTRFLREYGVSQSTIQNISIQARRARNG